MKPADPKKIELLIEKVEKEYGKGSLFRLGDNAPIEIARVETGLPDLDWAMGGGLPEGRILELYGANSAGKTSLAYHLMARYPQVLFIDAEGTFDEDLCRAYGNADNEILIRKPQWGEQAFELLYQFAEAGIPLIVVDSIPALIPRKDYEEDDMEKNAQIGAVARLMSRKLPRLVHLCEQSGTTIIFINQVRSKIGILFGDPLDTPGGHAFKHFCSLRLQLARKSWFDHAKLGRYGQICRLRVVKSKVCAPMREAELNLIFGRGFVGADQVAVLRKEMLKDFRARAVQDNSQEGDEES